MSSVTVKKLNLPALHPFVAWRGLDQPARGSRVIIVHFGRIGTHEEAHTASSLGSKLQPPRIDLPEAIDRCDGHANPSTTQAFRHRPELVGAIPAPKQDQATKVDSGRRQCRKVKLTVRIAPCDGAAVFLGRNGQQQRE